MKIIIAGSRNFDDYQFLKEHCDVILEEYENVEIVSGKAKGPDTMAIQYAKEHNYPVKIFPADWDSQGRKAGILRNLKMAEYADMLIAFWNGKSRGTKHMIDIARKNSLFIAIIEV